MTKEHDLVEEGSSLFFEGRAWLDKANGNTYHSVRIWVNGEVVEVVPLTYGYENAYQVSAISRLVELGYLPETLFQHGIHTITPAFPVWQIARYFGITIYSVLSYGNKSELFKRGK
jgi:hypothetical protein